MTQPFSRPIFWPLALIALGVLWILGNFGVIANSNLWALLRFWPVFLIALGLDLIVRQRWPWLGNVIALLTVTLAVLAVVFAPQLGLAAVGGAWPAAFPFIWGGEPGSGRIVTEARPVSDFDGVAFSSFGEMTIQQGEAEALTIEAEDNILPEIRTEVRNGTLYIGFSEEDGWARVRPTKTIRFILTVKNLKELDLSGAGSVIVSSLKADQLDVVLSGAGSLSAEGLDASDLHVRLSGAGSINASGSATRLEARLSGLGSYKGENLQTETADVTISGTGSAVVWATRQLEARISGLGSVEYFGQPEVTENISGLGQIRHLGNK
jgi:NADH:ubiquinone oxidoreductase subunit K